MFAAAASGARSVAAGAGEEGLGGGCAVVNAGAHASAGRPPHPSRERKNAGVQGKRSGDRRSDAGRHQVQSGGRRARPEAPRAQRRGVQARGVLRGEGKRRLQQIAGLFEGERLEGQRMALCSLDFVVFERKKKRGKKEEFLL